MALAWFTATVNGSPQGSYKIGDDEGKSAHSAVLTLVTKNRLIAEYLTLIRLLEDNCLPEGALICTESKQIISQVEKNGKAGKYSQYKQGARRWMKEKRAKLVLVPRAELVAQLGG